MTASRGILPPRHVWTDVELKLLRTAYPEHKASAIAELLGIELHLVYKKAKQLGLAKSEAFKASAASGRMDGVRGAQTRFKPGHVPWTAGKKGLQMSPATQFKKGQPPANVQEVGALRINTLGDIDIKVAPGPRNWVSLRRYAWEQAFGPVPPKMCIVPLNGDGHDTRIENLRLVNRAENIRHNLLRRYPKELRNVMALRGRLETKIKKQEEVQHG
jgi:hypothetical protein